MSIFNGAGAVGSQLGAWLTDALHVSESDFSNLGPLVAVCNLSSLLPLLAIGWLDAAPAAALKDPDAQPTAEPGVVDVAHVEHDDREPADGPDGDAGSPEK